MRDGRKITSWILLAALVVGGIWGVTQYNQKNSYKTYLENQYLNEFYSLINSMENIEASLAKSMVSGSDEQMTLLFTETWKNADLAQNNLSRLPTSHLALNETSKFLNQLGDFSYAIGKQTMDGKNISDFQWGDLERLHNSSSYLMTTLHTLHQDMVDGGIMQFGEIDGKKKFALGRVSESIVEDHLTRVEKEMTTYPKLIYDGPFSSHLSEVKPKGLKGDGISRKEGEKQIISFMGSDRVGEINSLSRGEGVVNTYGYEVVPYREEGDRRAYVEVSRIGGKVVWMMDSKVVENISLSMPKALEKAQSFLEERGFSNMVPSYSEKYNGVAVFNFAYEQKDVLIYPDLIKVQVALDNGEIVGFEAQGFYMSHQKRNIPKPEMTLDEAKERVSNRLEIFKERLAIIPTEAKEEVLCYEFKGKFQGDTFIVYINAKTGKEQEILKVIKTNSGDLTM